VTHIQDLLAQPACRALGWALLHFLWQGSLAALLLAGCNLALRDSSARIRYGVSCLFLMLLSGAARAHPHGLPGARARARHGNSKRIWQSGYAAGCGRHERGIAAPSIAGPSLGDTLSRPCSPGSWRSGSPASTSCSSLRWIGAWTVSASPAPRRVPCPYRTALESALR
jgi:hypothetical protein